MRRNGRTAFQLPRRHLLIFLHPVQAGQEHTICIMNRSVPTDSMLAHLVYRDVAKASDWLKRVFGFTEDYRYGDPVSGVQMHLGGALIMLTGPRNGTESPTTLGFNTQMLTIFVEDVDAHFAHSKENGAHIWEELHETAYGERQYGVKDMDSHRWLFSQHARDVDPVEWGANVAQK
jgi:uncharacterized glyoxalase superfamily protein PhnB